MARPSSGELHTPYVPDYQPAIYQTMNPGFHPGQDRRRESRLASEASSSPANRRYTFRSIEKPRLPGFDTTIVWTSLIGAWIFTIDNVGSIQVIHQSSAHLSSLAQPGQLVYTWSFPIPLGNNRRLSLFGTPQVSSSSRENVAILVSWRIDDISEFESLSGGVPMATCTERRTFCVTFRTAEVPTSIEIERSSGPIAFAGEWACFSDMHGLPCVHARNVVDMRQTTLALDTYHGEVFGIFAMPSLSLFLINNEWDGVRIWAIEQIVGRAISHPAHDTSFSQGPRVRPAAQLRVGDIPHGAAVLHHPVAGAVLAIRRSDDFVFYCQVPPDGPGEQSAWAYLPIPRDEYVSAMCLGPEPETVILIVHSKSEQKSYLRVAVLPPFPAAWRLQIYPALATRNILEASGESNLLAHCNSIHLLPHIGSSLFSLLVGQTESTLWMEIVCEVNLADLPVASIAVIPDWLCLKYRDISVTKQDNLAVRARRTAGGLIREAPVPFPQAIEGLPKESSAIEYIDAYKADFYARPGPAMEFNLSFGVARPFTLIGAYDDGYMSIWVIALPTPKGSRWLAMQESVDDDSGMKTYEFRYSDVRVDDAVELLNSEEGAHRFKRPHPDASFIAQAIERDVAILASRQEGPAAYLAATIRLGC